MAELLTLKQIAVRLDLPPATVRYYRDLFSEYLPAVKVGRFPQYGEEALQVISDIRRLYGEGLDRDQVKAELDQNHAVNQGAELAATTTGATAQQYEKYLYLLAKQSNLLQEQQVTIAKQAAIIDKLTDQLSREQKVKEQLLLQEIKNRSKPEPVKRRWWQRGKH
jgi:DNA-binding transcriptional MerR regulator